MTMTTRFAHFTQKARAELQLRFNSLMGLLFDPEELNQRLRALRVEGGKAMMDYCQDHVRGHIQYYGVSGNIRWVTSYVYFAGKLLFKWLNRCSQRCSVPWERFSAILKRRLPRARVVHNLYPTPLWRTQTGSRMV
jgi:RNA-directed DNA polymerase